jgi:hypothetical protein
MPAAGRAALGEPMSLNRLFPRRLRRAALTLCAAAVLGACGGGDRAEPYVPTALEAYGDEMSLIDDGIAFTVTNPVTNTDTSPSPGNGVKYTVNGFNGTTGVLDCTVNPIWVQVLAANLGMAFKECAGTYTSFAAVSYAELNAESPRVIALLTKLRERNPGSKTVATVYVGLHDVLRLHQTVEAGTSISDAVAEAQRLGTLLGQEVTRVADAGIGIVVATLPNLGKSPYAAAKAVGRPTALDELSQLSKAFNDGLRLNIPGDGHKLALVFGKPTGTTSGEDPLSGYTGDASCVVDTPKCVTNTLKPGLSSSDVGNWLWADATHVGPNTHNTMGVNAYNRVRNTLAPGS